LLPGPIDKPNQKTLNRKVRKGIRAVR
jgi:hypothetical protein